jgi:hypothetical protein
MANRDDLKGLGFQEVYEVARGQIYELVAGARTYRMTVATTVLGPIYGKITFDARVPLATSQGEVWAHLTDAFLALGEAEDSSPDALLLRGAAYLSVHLGLEPADEE